jgi:predicted DNA-binding transcriptional regulator AlpA
MPKLKKTTKNLVGLPETGFLRLKQIIGDKEKRIPALIPVCASTWWAGVKQGRYPKPIKISPKVTVWRVEDICALIKSEGKES